MRLTRSSMKKSKGNYMITWIIMKYQLSKRVSNISRSEYNCLHFIQLMYCCLFVSLNNGWLADVSRNTLQSQFKVRTMHISSQWWSVVPVPVPVITTFDHCSTWHGPNQYQYQPVPQSQTPRGSLIFISPSTSLREKHEP